MNNKTVDNILKAINALLFLFCVIIPIVLAICELSNLSVPSFMYKIDMFVIMVTTLAMYIVSFIDRDYVKLSYRQVDKKSKQIIFHSIGTAIIAAGILLPLGLTCYDIYSIVTGNGVNIAVGYQIAAYSMLALYAMSTVIFLVCGVDIVAQQVVSCTRQNVNDSECESLIASDANGYDEVNCNVESVIIDDCSNECVKNDR
ncbi:hypothetical protein [Ehrlichia canis]|uniref:Uncharacterized protein n=1 Tax=Ehrlichia canis (strain Jake) TaxID=269484 RepID=A0ACA6AVP9_EHRCJ|nr:hypothetical protein [Ehrlichia canis]AAZ68458.1 hypothetical protein Ecaj_0415 [Ehrlichia canis str. Jake]AUO54792.1 hypothetical protein C1I72_02735 [Ehrlichia canis]UKC53582.1 hypothetical protein s20019040002_000625 [Ehrlichia canis]UKC54520.1 hypothetical protein s20026770001_000626 [Ehrlichia canis]UKC55456.1 hypothetical protein s21009500007_000626 [Ehrlichia canis]